VVGNPLSIYSLFDTHRLHKEFLKVEADFKVERDSKYLTNLNYEKLNIRRLSSFRPGDGQNRGSIEGPPKANKREQKTGNVQQEVVGVKHFECQKSQ